MDTIAVRTPDLVGFLEFGTPLEQAVKAWLIGHREPTRSGYARDINIYLAWCDEAGVDALTAKRVHLQVYAEWLKTRDWSSATANSRFSSVSSFYRCCLEDEIINRNPCEFVKRPKIDTASQKRPAPTPLEHGMFMHAAEKVGRMEHALFALLGMRGLRIAEACALDVTDVVFHDGYDHVRGMGKGEVPFDEPLPMPAARAVKAAIDDRTEGPLLLTKWQTRMSRNAAQRCIDRVAASAMLTTGMTPHSFRRGFVMTMLAGGAQLTDVQHSARHANPSTTQLYDRRAQHPDRDASHQLGAFIAGMRG